MKTASAGSSRSRRPAGTSTAVVLALAIALIGAACSSSDDNLDAGTSTTAASTETDEDGGDDEPEDSATDDDDGSAETDTDSTDPSLPASSDDGGGDTTAPDDADDEAASDEPPPDEQALPTTPEELVAALDEAELMLRRDGIDQAGAAPWGRRQQRLYRVLAAHPDWAEQVLAGVDPAVAEAVGHNWAGRQALVSLVNTETLHDTLPAWTIGQPPAADELLGYYREAEATTGVPWEILAAINLVETRMGRISGVSTAGAIGPMQFLPTTWAECCDGDPTVPRDAINGAGRYLVQRGAETDLDRAIFGYNNSNYYVTAIRSFAAVMEADERAYYGYHAWQVYYLSTEGLVLIPEGYSQTESIAVTDWLAANPETLFDPG